MQIPALTSERIQSIIQSEVAYLNSWLTNMREQFSNYGIQIVRFGNATAFITQSLSGNSNFNRVIGLTTQDEGHIDSIVQWYSENNIPCRIDLCPYQTDRDLLLSLTKHGLRESHYGTILYGVPSPDMSPPPSHIVVRKVHQQDLDLFSTLYAQGFLEFYGGSETNTKVIAESAKALYGHPEWHLYVAFVEETPAAAALLHIQDQIAVLVAATTVPQLRGKGCQTALIQQRIADAAHAGSTLLVTQTRAGTISQRNMEQAGLRIAYNRAVWETRT